MQLHWVKISKAKNFVRMVGMRPDGRDPVKYFQPIIEVPGEFCSQQEARRVFKIKHDRQKWASKAFAQERLRYVSQYLANIRGITKEKLEAGHRDRAFQLEWRAEIDRMTAANPYGDTEKIHTEAYLACLKRKIEHA